MKTLTLTESMEIDSAIVRVERLRNLWRQREAERQAARIQAAITPELAQPRREQFEDAT